MVFAEWHYPDGSALILNVKLSGVHVVSLGPDRAMLPVPHDGPAGAGICDDGPPEDGDVFEFALAA